MRSNVVNLSANVAVLRRWSHSRPGEALPENFASWKAANATEALQLQRQDPELVSLLNGTAPASLLADALQGHLSPIPVSQEQRASDARKAEMQALMTQQNGSGPHTDPKVRLKQPSPSWPQVLPRKSCTRLLEQDVAARARQAAQQEAELRRESAPARWLQPAPASDPTPNLELKMPVLPTGSIPEIQGQKFDVPNSVSNQQGEVDRINLARGASPSNSGR